MTFVNVSDFAGQGNRCNKNLMREESEYFCLCRIGKSVSQVMILNWQNLMLFLVEFEFYDVEGDGMDLVSRICYFV